MKNRVCYLLIVCVPFCNSLARDLIYSQKPDAKIKAEIVWNAKGDFGGETTATGDFVLAGGANGPDAYDNSMRCFDAETGQLLWQSAHPTIESRLMGIPQYGITSKPFLDGERVYYVTVNWHLVCADVRGFHDGENDGPLVDETSHDTTDADILWDLDFRKNLTVTPRAAGDVAYVQSSPLVVGDLVYVVTGHGPGDYNSKVASDAPSFIAVDKMTGEVVWKKSLPGDKIGWANSGSPAWNPARNEIVFPGGDGCLYGLDALTGTQNWKADLNAIGGTKGLFLESKPEVVDGRIIASLRSIIEMGPQAGAPMIAVSPPEKNGGEPKVDWIFGKELDGFWWQSFVMDGVFYATSAPKKRGETVTGKRYPVIPGFLHALDPETGHELWRLEIPPSGSMGVNMGGADGRLYLANEDGEITMVKTGKTPEVLATFELREGVGFARPAMTKHGLCVAHWGGVTMLKLSSK